MLFAKMLVCKLKYQSIICEFQKSTFSTMDPQNEK